MYDIMKEIDKSPDLIGNIYVNKIWVRFPVEPLFLLAQTPPGEKKHCTDSSCAPMDCR